MDKGTDFKFGRHIHRVHPNKSPLKFWRKFERGYIQGLPFLGTPLSQQSQRVRLRTFVRAFHGFGRNKIPLKISGKVGVGVLRDSGRKSSGHPYRPIGASRGHLCGILSFLVISFKQLNVRSASADHLTGIEHAMKITVVLSQRRHRRIA